MIKVGISGFGRISRVVMRAALDMDDIEIAGISGSTRTTCSDKFISLKLKLSTKI